MTETETPQTSAPQNRPTETGDQKAQASALGWGGARAPSRGRWRLPGLVILGLVALLVFMATTRLISAASPVVEPPLNGRLALMPFLSATADPSDAWVETGLMEMVVETVSRTAGASIVSAQRLRRELDPRDLNLHDSEARERGRALAFSIGAAQVLDVIVRRRGEKIALDLELFESSGSIWQARIEAGDPLAAGEALVFALGRGLTADAEPRSLRQFFSRSPFLDRLYGAGLHELRVDGAAAARPYFEIALRHRPAFLQAKTLLAECVRSAGDLEGARELTSDVLREAQARGERALEARSLRDLALLEAFAEEVDKASELYTQAFAIHIDMGDEPARAEVLFELARLALARGETARAEELYVERLGVQQALGDRLGEADSLFQIGSLLLTQGDLEGAERVLKDARERALQAGDVWTEMRVAASLGEVAQLTGDLETAKSLWRRALTFYEQRDETPRRLLLSYKLAESLVKTGEIEEAESRLLDIRELAGEIGDRRYEAKASTGLAWLLLRTGYPFQAKPHLDRALELDRWLDDRTVLQVVIAWYAYEIGNFPLAARTQLEIKRQVEGKWAPIDEAFLQVFLRAEAEGRRLPLPGEDGYVAL